jgi:hypothetical protein
MIWTTHREDTMIENILTEQCTVIMETLGALGKCTTQSCSSLRNDEKTKKKRSTVSQCQQINDNLKIHESD